MTFFENFCHSKTDILAKSDDYILYQDEYQKYSKYMKCMISDNLKDLKNRNGRIKSSIQRCLGIDCF